jgi:lipopolysaccharide export system protein LptA
MPRLIFLAAASVLFAAPAPAQIADGDQDLLVTSTKDMVFSRSAGTAIYEQNVRAVQGGSQLASDKLTVFCTKPANGGPVDTCDPIQRIVAEGNVIYTTPRERIRGDRAEYDYPSDTITVTGEVTMARGKDIMRGNKVVYQVSPGVVTVTGEPGRGVMSIFTPERRNQNQTPAQNPPAPPAQN